VQALSLETGRRLITRHAGIFLFLPLLAQIRFDRLVAKADYAGSQMVPSANALLSLLSHTPILREAKLDSDRPKIPGRRTAASSLCARDQ